MDESVDGVCNTLICASSGTPAVSVPKASDQIDAAFSNIAFEASNFPSGDGAEVVIKSSGSSRPDFVILAHNPSSGACSVDASVLNNSRISGSVVNNASGQQYEHTVYYCPGDLTIKGDFSGAAVMSGRHITHDGASKLGTDASGGEAVDTFMYAIGGIKLNGKTEAYGEFVSDAEPPLKQGNQDVGFFQAGNSKVYGTIISGGDITANGGMEFEAMETGRIRYLSSGRLDSWDEYEDPG